MISALFWFTTACGVARDTDCSFSFYADADGDGHGVSVASATGCVAPPGYETTSDDCDDTDATIHPGADERCNEIDDDCDGSVDGGGIDGLPWYADGDHDGHGDPSDVVWACAAPRGFVATADDCVDTDPAIHPGADEVCNEIDDDCDASIDADDPGVTDAEWYIDADGDGFGDPVPGPVACKREDGATRNARDCDDSAAEVHPFADEICNEIDDDCDELTDDVYEHSVGAIAFFVDADGDGVGGPESSVIYACSAPSGYVESSGDCDDADPTLGGTTLAHEDNDGDGFGNNDTLFYECGAAPKGWILSGGDCDDERADVFPGALEICNGIDDDCDRYVDADDLVTTFLVYADVDGDGFGDAGVSLATECEPPSGYVVDGTDCADDDAAVHPAAPEFCDGDDNDCNGSTDDDVVYLDWYADGDGDGYGVESDVLNACSPPSGYVPATGDCDDSDSLVSPNAEEICVNSVDDDCDVGIDDCAIALDDPDFAIVGPISTGFSAFGFDVLSADLNADGVADLVAGAPDLDVQVYVAFGPGAGLSHTADTDLSFSTATAYSGLGDALAASDVDGDGDDDLLLGVAGDDRAYLFLGPLTSGGDVATADVSFLASSPGTVGHVVEIVPDHDGDGMPDVVMDALDDRASSMRGSVYVAAATGATDLATDAAYTYERAGGQDELGAAIAWVGDTTGDGIDDLAIGAPGVGCNEVFVLPGGEAPGAYAVRDAAVGIVSSLRNDSFGHAIDAVDSDGDGYSDLFVGAPTFAPTVYGFRGPFGDERDTDDADVHWLGEEGLGFSLAVGGDVDADGEPDSILGAFSIDTAHGSAYLQRGAAEGAIDVNDLPSFRSIDGNVAGYASTFVADWTSDGGSEVALGAPFMSDGLSPGTGRGHVDVVFSERLY